MNETFIIVFVSCLFIGSLVGFLAGLLGIGGGLIIVPTLIYLLPLLSVSADIVMPIALATSLASIVITSSSAAIVHHQKNNIPWPLAKKLMTFVAIGALIGAYIASILSAKALTTFFASAVTVLAVYMLFSTKIENAHTMPSNLVLRALGLFTGILAGLFTGILASLMGIAGGVVLVPSLSYFGLPLRHTMGVATICGVMVAIFGSIGYIISGWGQTQVPEWSFGYIYLPALLGIVLSSSIFARYGVRMATKLPVVLLKKFFAGFLILVAIKMIVQ